jgi:hypothetical protein
MLAKRLIKSNDAGGCTNTVDLYNPLPDGGGIALYQLNGDATDVSGNYDGIASNVSYSAGLFDQTATFSGNSNSYIFLSSLNSFFLNGGNAQNFSVSLWFKTVNTGIFFSDFQGGYKAIISLNASGNLYVGTRAVAGDFDYATTETYNDGAWHHVVVTISKASSNNKKVYIDNILKNTSTIPSANGQYASSGSGNNVSLATFAANGTTYGGHNCSIDQVRVFSRALRPYEVEALYTEEYCTPTIVPSEHFNTVLYTGNGGTNSVTGVGFQPDFVWVKSRSIANYNVLATSVQGVQKGLISSLIIAEFTDPTTLTSFDVNGFTVGSDTSYNTNGATMVSWNFKAGGAAVLDTSGDLDAYVSANQEAGFSIIKHSPQTATGQTIPHGLSKPPKVTIHKSINNASAWGVFAPSILGDQYLYLYTDTAGATSSNYTFTTDDNFFYTPTSGYYFGSIFSGDNLIYAFAEVEGFSNFGSYVGTGASGNTVVTGFEPAFVMIKRTDAVGGWLLLDDKRDTTNPRELFLSPNTSQAEFPVTNGADFLENGFTIQSTNGSLNASGASYIYMAFAADPTTIEPTLEDSFNTVLYTSTGGSQSITGLGFQPDLLWTKNRTATWYHQIVDSVRLAPNTIYSNSTQAESTPVSYTSSLDADGFTVNYTETIGSNYVAWAWKGAEIPAINSNGSIPSVVSANPAAGFSIVSYTGNGVNPGATIGHGLNQNPDFIIAKSRSASGEWPAFHSALPISYTSYWNATYASSTYINRYSAINTETFTTGSSGSELNTNGVSYIAYCFAEVAGFSKFGSYSGGSTGSGNVINVGFKPLFLMVKRTDIAGDAWQMFDTVRGGGDTFDNYVQGNTSAAEVSYNQREVNFTNNGFYWTFAESGTNISGGTYIYMAFANQF